RAERPPTQGAELEDPGRGDGRVSGQPGRLSPAQGSTAATKGGGQRPPLTTGRVPRMVRGRPSGLKAACGTAARRPGGPTLTPETTAAPGGRTQGPGSSLPPRCARHPGYGPPWVG